MLALGGCLQPIGFPWLDDTDTAAASSTSGTSTGTTGTTTGTTTTSTATTADAPTTSSTSTSTSTATSTSTSSSTSTSTSDTTSTSSSTTDPGPMCGDTVVEGDEECDDGNDDEDDGCTSQCGRDRRIFVTNTRYQGHKIGGLDQADDLCRAAAETATLPGAQMYKAWLSSQTIDARDRLVHGKGRYVRLDDLVVAYSWDDLVDGELENPIAITETDVSYTGGVWTGTKTDGTRGVGADQCKDWTTSNVQDPLNGGFHGFAGQYNEYWTFVPNVDINPAPCGFDMALYCLEQ